MVIDPRRAIAEEWLKADDPITEKQIQPNGIDLRVDMVELLGGQFVLFAEGVVVPVEHIRLQVDGDDCYHLLPGRVYEFTALEYVIMPEGVMAQIIHRSSLNRNGVLATGSVYDSGFRGYCGFSVRPLVRFTVERYTRVAQIIFYEAQGKDLYDGQYQDESSE